MKSRLLTFTVTIPASPDFTGNVLVSVESGTAKGGYALQENEFTGTLESFLEAVKYAGYQVIPPAR